MAVVRMVSEQGFSLFPRGDGVIKAIKQPKASHFFGADRHGYSGLPFLPKIMPVNAESTTSARFMTSISGVPLSTHKAQVIPPVISPVMVDVIDDPVRPFACLDSPNGTMREDIVALNEAKQVTAAMPGLKRDLAAVPSIPLLDRASLEAPPVR